MPLSMRGSLMRCTVTVGHVFLFFYFLEIQLLTDSWRIPMIRLLKVHVNVLSGNSNAELI